MSQIWMVPLAVLIGVSGTYTVLKVRHFLKNENKDWLVPVLLFWSPLFYWIGAQIAGQAH